MALLDTMGLKRHPGTILPMGERIYVEGMLPAISTQALKSVPDNCYILGHVPARCSLDGFRVITVLRDPRNVLISYVRHRQREDGIRITIPKALEDFWGWGPFVETYRSFLGWINRSIIIRYEDMPSSMVGTGSGIYREHQHDWNTNTGAPSQWFHFWTNKVDAAWQKHGGPQLLFQAGYK